MGVAVFRKPDLCERREAGPRSLTRGKRRAGGRRNYRYIYLETAPGYRSAPSICSARRSCMSRRVLLAMTTTLLAVVLVTPSDAQGPQPVPQASDFTVGSGSIVGTVISAAAGRPLRGRSTRLERAAGRRDHCGGGHRDGGRRTDDANGDLGPAGPVLICRPSTRPVRDRGHAGLVPAG